MGLFLALCPIETTQATSGGAHYLHIHVHGVAMASIYKVGKRWRAQVSIKGARETEVFDTKQMAAAWALEKEAARKGRKLPRKTFGDALGRFSKEIACTREGGPWEVIRCAFISRSSLGTIMLEDLEKSDIVTWRDERLKTVKSSTVLRDINLMRAVFKLCRTDWGWMRHNPLEELQLPKAPKGRRRRITPDEITRVRLSFGLDGGLHAKTATHRVGLAFLFAIETAMRAGEILGLTWGNVHLDKRFVHIKKSKNGEARDVPLSNEAVKIMGALPRLDGTCFGLRDRTRDALSRKCIRKAAVDNLHFHDTRAEGIWRLSKKLDVLQLARAIGHRDLKSLLIYYNESAEDMAKRLD